MTTTLTRKAPSYATETVKYEPKGSKLKAEITNFPHMSEWLGMTGGDEQTARNLRYCALEHLQVRGFKSARESGKETEVLDFWTWEGPKRGGDPTVKMAKAVEKLTDAEKDALRALLG